MILAALWRVRGLRQQESKTLLAELKATVVAERSAIDPDPTPDEIAAATEEVTELMQKLKPDTRRVLQLRLQGYALSEIADQTGRSERTIRRTISDLKQLLVRRAIENRSPTTETQS